MSGIPVLADIIAPNHLWSATVRGELVRNNKRAQNVGGFKQIQVRWSTSLRMYEFGTVPLDLDVWRTLEALYEYTDAGGYGFLLQDPADCIIPRSIGRVINYESSDNTYRLVERKTVAGGAFTHDRVVTRPEVSPFRLFISDVEEMSYTLDEETGVVTIPSDPDPTTVSWSGRSYVPVHFAEDKINWELVVAGPAEARFFAGPAVRLEEIREE
jgi:uncharacterized protein (TIGR02217 family)